MKNWIVAACLVCLGSASRAQDAAPTPLATVSGTAVDAPATIEPVIVGKPNGHYFRFMDPHHLQLSAGTLYDLHGVAPLTYVTEVAIVTHSTADGSILSPKLQKLGISAEDWTPFQVGAGGSAKIVGGRLKGGAVVAFGTSGNACPLVLGWAVSNVGPGAPLAMQIAKAAILGDGTDYAKLRIGYVFQGTAIADGVFQSAKEAFPGRGVLDIANRSGRLELSVSKRL